MTNEHNDCQWKENTTRKLDDVIGKTSPIRRELVDYLFGDDGLSSVDNVMSFDERVARLREPDGLMSKAPVAFAKYAAERLIPLMRINCAAGRGCWTNNNCESINHALKRMVNWQPQQLPNLIDMLRQLVDGQYADADRALCGRGDFSLRPDWSKHRQTVDVWSSLSLCQRRRAAEACFKMQPTTSTSTTSDGTLTVPTTPGGGKKPHQRKRCRANRTTTVNKKNKIVDNSDSD